MTYHSKLKSMDEVILKYLEFLYMGKEVKRMFAPKPKISLRVVRQLSSYLGRAKIYPIRRTVASDKSGGKLCVVCINKS